VSHSFDEKSFAAYWIWLFLRGDPIGLIGPEMVVVRVFPENSLGNLELLPVRVTTVPITSAYFDQLREQLDARTKPWENVVKA